MDEKKIDFLLHNVPENVDYTTTPEEFDLESVLQEGVNELIELLSNENEVLRFDSAHPLAYQGIDEGFDTSVLMLEERRAEGMADHRLHGCDNADRHILSTFISYWTSEADQSQQKGDGTRRRISPPVVRIIRKAPSVDLPVGELFWLVTETRFIEYVPLVKGYLQYITDCPSKQYWEIRDTVKPLLEIEPQFIHNSLESKHKKLPDFGLQKEYYE